MLASAATLSYAPFLWEMCFSGRPFLHGIQIFLSGFWVSSRGFDCASSSIVRSPEKEADETGTRDLFPWCCSEGDRCFISDARWGWRLPRIRRSRSLYLSPPSHGITWFCQATKLTVKTNEVTQHSFCLTVRVQKVAQEYFKIYKHLQIYLLPRPKHRLTRKRVSATISHQVYLRVKTLKQLLFQ